MTDPTVLDEAERRTRRAEAVLRAVRTTEASAAEDARAGLSEMVVMERKTGRSVGINRVVPQLARKWPLTPVLAQGAWEIFADGPLERRAVGRFPGLGAAPERYELRMLFDEQGLIQQLEETIVAAQPAQRTCSMTGVMRGRIDRALAEGKALSVAYVDDAGNASLSLRGSVQTFSHDQLCLWARSATGGLVRAVEAGRMITLLYRDNASRTTMTISARGRVACAEERALVYQMSPEVEQLHDPEQTGAAVILDILTVRGTSPEGPIQLVAARQA